MLVAIGSHVCRFTPPHRYKHCSVNNCLPFLFNNSVPKEFSTVGDALFWSCFITNPKIGEKLKLTPLPLLRSSLSLQQFKLLHFLLFRISSPDWLCSGEDPSFLMPKDNRYNRPRHLHHLNHHLAPGCNTLLCLHKTFSALKED